MKKFIYLAVFVVILAVSNGKIQPEPAPTRTPVVPEPTTPAPNTTAKPITTTQIPTTPAPTTPAPTTPVPTTPVPTTKPPTTTTTTTTTSTTSTTTTPVPTTVAPTPTSKPTPKPIPQVHTWNVPYPDDKKKVCIMMKMALHLEIPYETMDNKTKNASVCLPPTAIAHGECGNGNTTQEITLVWNATTTGDIDSIKFVFDKNDTTKQFMVTSITAKITPDSINFPDMKGNNTITADYNKKEFITPMTMSYKCNRETKLMLNIEDGKNSTGQFIVKDLQLEAFHKATGQSFSTAEDCESSSTPGIVPIAVGCSLAALIIIVLIAYLVGRRRSQARGYLSM